MLHLLHMAPTDGGVPLTGNHYRPGDIIYLGRENGSGRITLVPVVLVALVSVSLDGELWKVRNQESGDLCDHFIQYPSDDLGPGREEPLNAVPS
jgi:hypothetical protein